MTQWKDRLAELRKPPIETYHCGSDLDQIVLENSVAIVGSRDASQKGVSAARELGRKMASEGRVVISGLALGVDTAAFEGALDGEGVCIAVLPCGVDIITPTSNANLAQRIIDFGGTLFSELPEGVPPQRHTFIQRNRLIAALSDTIVLGEARDNGGAWHTVREGWKLNRAVFTLASDGKMTPLVNPQRGLDEFSLD